MKLQDYQRIQRPFLQYPRWMKIFQAAYLGLPATIYLIYPAVLALLLWRRDHRIWMAGIVPAVVLLAVTMLRRWINAPRPYEQLGVSPLIPKSTKGQSFPSRHCASAMVIGAVLWEISVPLGIYCGLAALAMAFCRVVAGVHYPRDVSAGLAMGLVLGRLGCYLFSVLG